MARSVRRERLPALDAFGATSMGASDSTSDAVISPWARLPLGLGPAVRLPAPPFLALGCGAWISRASGERVKLTASWRRRSPTPRFRMPTGPRCASRTTGNKRPRSRLPTARSCTGRAFSDAGSRVRPPALVDLRRHLLLRRRLARRRLPRRHRGLLRAPFVRGHGRAVGTATTTSSHSRSHARRNATAPPSARSPACSGTGMRPTRRPIPGGPWQPMRVTETGTDAHRRYAGALHRSEHGTRPARVRTHARRRRGAARRAPACGDRRRSAASTLLDMTRDVTLASGENLQSWVLTVDDPPRWWPRSLGAQPLCTVTLTVDVAGVPSDTAHRPDRISRDPVRRLGVLRQRRAAVPQGHEPGADAHGARRGDDGNDSPRPRTRAAGESRLRPRARARRPPGAVRRRRRARAARLARPPVAVGIRPRHPQTGRRVRRGRWSTSSATIRACSCGVRTTHPSPPTVSPVKDGRAARVSSSSPRRCCPRGRSRCSTVRSRVRSRVTTAPVRSAVTAACSPGSPKAARTRTSTTAGTTARSAASPRHCADGRVPVASCRSSARKPCPTPTTGWSPIAGPISTGDEIARHHVLQVDEFAARIPPAEAKTLDEWRASTQAYQAALLQLQIEDLRRVKYAPTGGFAQFSFVGSAPGRQLVGAGPRARPQARLRRAPRRVPAGAPDDRAARRPRPRRQRHPRRPGRRRSSRRRSTAAGPDGAATSPPTASRSSPGSTSPKQSTSRSRSSTRTPARSPTGTPS